jgi:hypothetical protein
MISNLKISIYVKGAFGPLQESAVVDIDEERLTLFVKDAEGAFGLRSFPLAEVIRTLDALPKAQEGAQAA